MCSKKIILILVSVSATWILCKKIVSFIFPIKFVYFLLFILFLCTVHSASSWLSMVSIEVPCAGKRSSWFWSRHRQPKFYKQVIFLFFSSFEIVSFSIFSVKCTFCILLGFIGFHRPGLKPYAGRDHPDFGLGIRNLDSLQTWERCALIQLLMEFRISWYCS